MSCYEYLHPKEIEEELARRAERAIRRRAEQEAKEAARKERNPIVRFLLAIGVLTITSGCASITHGTKQEITFNPPADRVCAVSHVSGILGSVQQSEPTLTVPRDNDPITLDCGDSVTVYEPAINAAAYTSILWIDFGLTDFATGAAWTYSEKQ